MSYVAPNIDPYRKGQSFASWFKRLGYHFRVNKVADADKKDQMFLLGGDYLFEVAQNLYFSEQLLDDAPLDEMIDKLKQKLDKSDTALIQRFKFGSRVQQPGETAGDFLFSLKLQAEYCNFKGDKQDRILDRILIGLSDDALRQKLLAEDGDKLNLAQVEKIISTWELAASNAKTLTQNNSLEQIASIVGSRDDFFQRLANLNQGHGPMKSRVGYRHFPGDDERNAKPYNRYNNRANHRSETERVRQERHHEQQRWYQDAVVHPVELKSDEQPVNDHRVCYFCGVRGHVRRRCPKLEHFKRSPINNINFEETCAKNDDNLSNRMSCWEDKSDDSDPGELQCMHVSSMDKSHPCLLELDIQGINVQMEIDSGSDVSMIGKKLFLAKFNVPLEESFKSLVVVNGSSLKIAGEVVVSVVFQNMKAKLKLLVLDSDHDFIPLFGRTWLDVFFPNWRNSFEKQVSGNRIIEHKNNDLMIYVTTKLSDVFIKDFLTPIKGNEAELVLKIDTPIYRKAFDVPNAIRDNSADNCLRFPLEQSVADLEKIVSACDASAVMAEQPKQLINTKWIPSTKLFGEIHQGFFYYKHHVHLLNVDGFSNWMEVEWMKNRTECKKLIKLLLAYLAKFGFPDRMSGNSPLFNPHDFNNFFERQGIWVLDSSPYNLAINGKAERIVRKDVMRKFLLDSKYVKLEDLIGLFLINFKNYMTMEGLISSRKVSVYTLKLLINMINVKEYKNNSYVPLSNCDNRIEEITNRSSTDSGKMPSKDLLDSLMVGDALWYKNSNPHHQAKWLKAYFLKRVCKNILQITTGNGITTTAHRSQIKIINDADSRTRRRMVVYVDPIVDTDPLPPPPSTYHEEPCKEPFRGFSESDLRGRQDEIPTVKPNRKRKMDEHLALDGLPRRSKRTRKNNHKSEFQYF
ncbi:uncharacterized protein LOC134222259 [Armigeres subalbatus]|uniref:uncharacterized protein LOC134222259 n=1 Tax=Armigeres subalbatus TaxID=124917 RepID=UPI002ED0882D